MDSRTLHPDSIAAQALGWIDEATRAVIPPIHVSTTYLRDPDNQYRSGRVYARADNPAFDQAEAVINALEGGREALLFASGMAAATACFQALRPGDHVLVPQVMYWSLRNWLAAFGADWGVDVESIDMTSPAALRAALRPGRTRLVWVETPANPLWSITDIADAAAAAHAAGALLAVDSTVATPVFTRPLALGADLVMHSATKYLNGHSDIVGGMLVVGDDAELAEQITFLQNAVGGVQGPFDSFLALRGLKTLHLRMKAHCENAMQLAAWLEKHPAVAKVAYPGLASHPQHELARRAPWMGLHPWASHLHGRSREVKGVGTFYGVDWLPSRDLAVCHGGVFWPTPADPEFALVNDDTAASSDHRLVWIDVAINGRCRAIDAASRPGPQRNSRSTPTGQ